jgi:transcriptional regulator with XRE-family HTH domain
MTPGLSERVTMERAMPPSGSPAASRRLLAAELRRLRSGTGRTAASVGAELGWSKAKISRYELAQSSPKPGDLTRLLDVYEVTGDYRAELLALAADATHKGWWEPYSDVLTEGHTTYIGLEAEATSILEWQVSAVPGLLQIEQYAWEVLSGLDRVAATSPRSIQRQVETRLMRQHLLTGENPPDYTAVLDESVLYRQRGGRRIMLAQLQRLAAASELPNVTIRLLPLRGNHDLSVDSFSILQFGDPRETVLADVVSVEHLTGELHVARDSEAHAFRLAFDYLTSESLSPAESRELILAAGEREWGE